MNQQFGKKYKLCSQTIIKEVFDAKTSIKLYPFVLHYKFLELKEEVPFQLVTAVPKRTFKRAHDRNRIKRLMREAIRRNKLILSPHLTKVQVAFFMVYTAREELEYRFILKKTTQIFNQFTHEISPNDLSKETN